MKQEFEMFLETIWVTLWLMIDVLYYIITRRTRK